jgi:hypothetical protein
LRPIRSTCFTVVLKGESTFRMHLLEEVIQPARLAMPGDAGVAGDGGDAGGGG